MRDRMTQSLLVGLLMISSVAKAQNSPAPAAPPQAPKWLQLANQGFQDLVQSGDKHLKDLQLSRKLYDATRKALEKANHIVPVMDTVPDLAEILGAATADRTDWVGISETVGNKFGSDGSAGLGLVGGAWAGALLAGPPGALAGAFVGSLGMREVFDRVGKPIVDKVGNEIAATQGIKNSLNRLRVCQHWIARAERLAADGHHAEAGQLAWKAKSQLDSLYTILRQANATSKRDQLNQRVLALLAKLPSRAEIERRLREKKQRIEAITRVRELLTIAAVEAKSRRLKIARRAIEASKRYLPVLKRHKETHWINKIQAYDRALAKVESRTSLSGSAPWQGAGIGGRITLTINVQRQTFAGRFAGGQRGFNVSGSFGGRFQGNAQAGSLHGGGSIRTSFNGRGGKAMPAPVKARLAGGVVSGTVTFDGRSHPFSVQVR